MENWGVMTSSWGMQLSRKTGYNGAGDEEDAHGSSEGRRPKRVMARRMTSRGRRKLLNSPQALLARGHSVLT
jgi:predicted kinase